MLRHAASVVASRHCRPSNQLLSVMVSSSSIVIVGVERDEFGIFVVAVVAIHVFVLVQVLVPFFNKTIM